jgi:flavin-dependent dehydrogenase
MTQGRDHMPSNATSAARRPAKVVVVGAGPAGSTCALELRRHGVGDVVLVDRSEYPRRKVCGSGLSPLALGQLAALDLLDTMRPLHIEMRGLRVVGPGGTEVRLEGAKGAWVVPRTELDHRLVQAAIAEGVTMREGMRVTEIVRDAEGEARGVKTPDEEIEADLVVIANGSPSSFERDEHPREGIRHDRRLVPRAAPRSAGDDDLGSTPRGLLRVGLPRTW